MRHVNFFEDGESFNLLGERVVRGLFEEKAAGNDRLEFLLAREHSAQLPVQHAESRSNDRGEEEPVKAENGATGRPPLDRVRVLAVDDHADTRDLIEIVLAGAGAEVLTAASCAEVMEILSGLPIDRLPEVMICDIAIPDEDGYTVLHKLRAFEDQCCLSVSARIQAIAITAFVDDRSQRQALAAGFRRYLSKPFEAEQLISVIADLTGRSG
ncbi:MAG TPA: response regulator [Blastocatellia bacterium]|nr:response regulator [Blastocatellia bacterium]